MRLQLNDGQIVFLDSAFSYGNVNYPAGWLRNLSVQDRTAQFGAVEVAEPEAPVTPAPPSVPQSVTRAQAKIALHRIGKLVPIQSYIDASEDVELKLWWNEASEFRRDNQYVNNLAPAFSMTQEDLDDVFRTAAGIV